ncbi:anaphase-promoting complex subunit 2-like [Amphiura filiformis]|uniref:anaphase-promoting complex subunit 2-like n=1 Tax=Amphiura filiformis TaxID=82378 RepID=UPI003B20E81D
MASDVESVRHAWHVLTTAFNSPIKHVLETQDNPEIATELHQATELLHQRGMGHLTQEWFMQELRRELQRDIVPQFWRHFQPTITTQSKDINIAAFTHAVNQLHSGLALKMKSAETLESLSEHCSQQNIKTKGSCITERVKTLIKAILFSRVPKSFHEHVKEFYSQAFKAYHHSKHTKPDDSQVVDGMDITVEEDDDDDDGEEVDGDDVKCPGCSREKEGCQCKEILRTFHQTNAKLFDLDLLERICGEPVTTIIHDRIKHHVDQTCKGEFETSFLEPHEKWLEHKVVGWLNLVFCGPDSSRGTANSRSTSKTCIAQWKDRLQYFFYQTYARLRIQELFNIIVEFPDSLSALEDLKSCLEKTELRTFLMQSLRSDLEKRLLHPGVNTDDILTQYVSSIRALKVLDPSGIILELVCEPVRKYLRTRDDTVRCIVSSLTDDSNRELAEELVKAEPLHMDESYSSEHEEEKPEEWLPDPIDADPRRTAKSRRSSDIISTLVNIYGSRELFVNEYRGLLADRILSGFSYDTARELRYLELLKLRFGETQLHHCEVMLKDVADSRRCNSHIQSLKEEGKDEADNVADFNSMILSAQFWPSLKEEKLEVPESIKKAMEKYTKSYELLKGMRTLNWKTNLGLVNLEIELKDRKLNLSVSPIHATIIMHFQDKAKWTIEELSGIMQVPSTALRRKIAFWQSQGILKEESTDTFVLVEEQRGPSGSHDVVMMDSDDEAESAMASAKDQREEELQVFWSYIVGMLTNLGSLPLERIHSMLKMFAMQGPSGSELTEHELRQFLDRKVREQLLVYAAGVYRVPKGGS